jgi:hypothetical protein
MMTIDVNNRHTENVDNMRDAIMRAMAIGMRQNREMPPLIEMPPPVEMPMIPIDEKRKIVDEFLSKITVDFLRRILFEYKNKKDGHKFVMFDMTDYMNERKYECVTLHGNKICLLPNSVGFFGHQLEYGGQGYQKRDHRPWEKSDGREVGQFEQLRLDDAWQRANDWLAHHYVEEDGSRICVICISTPKENDPGICKEREDMMKKHWSQWGWKPCGKGSCRNMFVIIPFDCNPAAHVPLWHMKSRYVVSERIPIERLGATKRQ